MKKILISLCWLLACTHAHANKPQVTHIKRDDNGTTTVHYRGYKNLPSRAVIRDPHQGKKGCRTVSVRYHDKKGKPQKRFVRVCD